MTKKIPAKEDLSEKYAKEGTTISSLAREYSVTNPTIRSWLIQYSIKLKSHKQASVEANRRHRSKVKPTKEFLEKLYETASIKSLEKYFSVSQETIYGWLADYSITRKVLAEAIKINKQQKYKDIQFSRKTLDENYDRSKHILVLAESMNVSRTHIRNQLILNNIDIVPVESATRSKAETTLYELLLSEFPSDVWSCSNRSIIGPLELDIVNHTKKIAIEYCGLYWHCEGSSGRDKRYHRDKFLGCKEAGYKLYTVFESDDIEKVKKFLFKVLGKTVKVGARKTAVLPISSLVAMNFHREHHFHGAIGGSHHYGLFYGKDMLMVASFGKSRFSDKYEYECARITSHGNYTTVGGVSKLMKHFIRTENPKSIITFADLRFGEGKVYEHSSFSRLKDSNPNYWYTYRYSTELFSRVKFQKHKLPDLLEDFDLSRTEYENMRMNNWDRIWDCGNAKYVWYSS